MSNKGKLIIKKRQIKDVAKTSKHKSAPRQKKGKLTKMFLKDLETERCHKDGTFLKT